MELMRVKNLFKKELVCHFNRRLFEQVLLRVRKREDYLPAIQKELNSSTITYAINK